MGTTENRRWTAAGIHVRGSAPGQPDQVWAATPFPGTPGDVDELHEVAVKIAAYLNGQISTNDQAVLDAVLAHQAEHDWPVPITRVAEVTGLSRQAVHDSFNRLVLAGFGSRPPKGSGGARPFRATTPAEANR